MLFLILKYYAAIAASWFVCSEERAAAQSNNCILRLDFCMMPHTHITRDADCYRQNDERGDFLIYYKKLEIPPNTNCWKKRFRDKGLHKTDLCSWAILCYNRNTEKPRKHWKHWIFRRCRGQVVRQRSAKPSLPSSNLGGTSISSEHFGSIGEKPSCFKVFRLFYGRKFSKNSMDQWPLCRGSNGIWTSVFPYSSGISVTAPFFRGLRRRDSG